MLQPGDAVRVIAPAGVPDGRLDRGIEILESFGLVVEPGEHLYDKYGYLAAVRRHPRVFVGFSDMTTLIGRLWHGRAGAGWSARRSRRRATDGAAGHYGDDRHERGTLTVQAGVKAVTA